MEATHMDHEASVVWNFLGDLILPLESLQNGSP